MAPSKVSLIAVCALVAATAGTVALAQTKEEWREAKEGAAAGPQLVLEQSYHGTVPGAGNQLPRVEEIKGKPGSWITWPGFVMRPDGGSRLFLQTTKELAFEKIAKKGRVQLRFRDARVHLDNNRNPLVTINFNTPLKTAYLKRQAKRVDLVMELKEQVDFVVTQQVDADGYCYLFVDFPPGQFSTGGDWRPQQLVLQPALSSDEYLQGLPPIPPAPAGGEGAAPPPGPSGSPGGAPAAAPSQGASGGVGFGGAGLPAGAVIADEGGGSADGIAEAPDSEIFPAN